jgi:hypothetical protein
MDSVFCQSDLQFWFGIANLIDRPHFKPIIDQIVRKCKSPKHKYQGLVFQFPQNTRVGIVNLLESHATHKNISNFATENFTKTYQVDWDIPSYAENQ